MIKVATFAVFTALVISTLAQPIVPTNAPSARKTISIQEMLVSGPPQLKMHSLAMLTQSNIPDPVDGSYLPGFTVCAEDISSPIRSIAAKLLGQYFIQGKESPNPEALALLIKLAKDESPDVRFNAVYHGLSQIKNKSKETIAFLIEFAAANRQPEIIERIAESMKNNQKEACEILDKKLAEGDNVAIFEIYEDLTGKPPYNTDKYLDMPSSRPRMFIFKGAGGNAEDFKAELEDELKAVGITNPTVHISGLGENYVLIVKTYITKEGMAVEKNFSKDGKFQITQQMWLTPELEIQIDAMSKAQL